MKNDFIDILKDAKQHLYDGINLIELAACLVDDATPEASLHADVKLSCLNADDLYLIDDKLSSIIKKFSCQIERANINIDEIINIVERNKQ